MSHMQKIRAYKQDVELIDGIEGLKDIVARVLDDSGGLIVSRTVLGDLLPKLYSILGPNPDDRIKGCNYILGEISSRGITTSLEESVSYIYEMLATAHIEKGEYRAAANALQSISLESGQRFVEDSFKAKVYVRIMRCLLEIDNTAEAETYLGRVSLLIPSIANDSEQLLFFKSCQARISDGCGRFIEAASKYYELALAPELPPDERVKSLAAATICTILSSPSPERSRLLSAMYRDNRVEQKLPQHFFLLSRIYLRRFVNALDMEAFLPHLNSHYLTVNSSGRTLFAEAMIEHNLRCTSLLYTSIGFSRLAELLGLESPSIAEEYVAEMIGQGKMEGIIEQPKNLLYFDISSPVERWHTAVRNLCNQLEICSGKLAHNNIS